MFRILTEDLNSESILSLCQSNFPAFVSFKGVGVWKGVRESSIIIEVAETEELRGKNLRNRVYTVAEEISELNHQESVLVQEISAINVFIESKETVRV